MHSLDDLEACELAALMVRVGRPTNQDDKDQLERWVSRLSRRGGWVLPHDTDLLA
jgi:hypothetical protein